MNNHRKETRQFLVWTRNGIAFCTSWFLILELIYNRIFCIDNIATDSLIKMVFFVVGGVVIFSAVFTRVIFKKWSFHRRLNCFMVLISIYECIIFYCAGLKGRGLVPWLLFVGIILVIYLLCIAIYHIYSKKQGELYTSALHEYQSKRQRNV